MKYSKYVSISAALLWLTVFVSDAVECAFYGHCKTCTAQGSWLSGCRWCHVDSRCHATASLYNPCESDENIKTSDLCPMEAPSHTHFDIDIAYKMILYSKIAYNDDPTTAEEFIQIPSTFHLNQTYVRYIDPSDDEDKVFAYLGYDTMYEHIVVAFRGSESTSQIASQVKHDDGIRWTDYNNVMAMEYFLTGAQLLVSTLYEQHESIWYNLKELKDRFPHYSLWITGHSLGGAMAAIATVDLLVHGKQELNIDITKGDILLYTLGAPRAGNYEFAQLLESLVGINNMYRIVNSADVVPHVPWCENKFVEETDTYNCQTSSTENEFVSYHAGIEVWFPEGEYKNSDMCGDKICVGEPHAEDVSCSNGLYPTYVYSSEDHSGYWDVLVNGGFC